MAIRKLLIIWKWEHLKSQKLNFQLQTVENSNDCIYSILEDSLDHLETWFETFYKSQISPHDELILLCHSPTEHRRAFLARCLEKFPLLAHLFPIYFGGGRSFIYYDKITEKGLLDQTTGFQDDVILGEGEVSVLVDGKVKTVAFDGVWNFYNLNKYKAPIYTVFREKLLLALFVNEKIPSINNWLSKQSKSALTDSITEFFAANNQIFQDNKHSPLYKSRDQLLSLLDKPSPTATEVRQATRELLKNIPGPIYL